MLPGWPYLLAAVLVAAAYKEADELPDIEEDDYIHELDRKRPHSPDGIFMRTFASMTPQRNERQELEGLLSEVDESYDDDDYADDTPVE